jgi:predicted phage tail component-like protein
MRVTFHIFYNGESCKDVGLSVISRPTIPVPEREYDTIKVEGRDGELHRDKKTYKDIEIPISFNFVSKTPDVWAQDLRKVKKWLYSGKDNRLILSDDPEYYYKVKKAVMSDTERTAKRKGKFEIVFTCESYMYRVDGQDEKEIGEYLYNPYMKSQPVYKIYGNGEITLEVNGNQVTAEVTEQLNIDTKLEICYNAANEINNAALTGKYEGLYLQEGDNNFKYTEGFKVVLVPNWREL